MFSDGAGSLGLVPRVCGELLEAMGKRGSLGLKAHLSVAYVEIFGGEVRIAGPRAWPRARPPCICPWAAMPATCSISCVALYLPLRSALPLRPTVACPTVTERRHTALPHTRECFDAFTHR